MPLYEYQCESCNEEFEQIVRFSEADLMPTCPACGGQQTHKKISISAAIGNTSTGSFSASTSSCGSGGGFT